MAKYSKLLSSIWSDPDFTALTGASQRLYMLLISQPDISTAGVLPLTDRRWVRLASDSTLEQITVSLNELSTGGFVIVDDDTQEVAVRTYIVHDGMHKVPNGRKAIDKAMSEIASTLIRTHVLRVLETLDVTLTERVGPPLQPIACRAKPVELTSSQQRNPVAQSTTDPFDLAVAAAIELRKTETVKPITNVNAWTRAVRAGIIADYGSRIHELLHQGTTPADAAKAALNGTTAPAEHNYRDAVEWGHTVAQGEIDRGDPYDPEEFEHICQDRDPIWTARATEAYHATHKAFA